jgi:hypothetical protein
MTTKATRAAVEQEPDSITPDMRRAAKADPSLAMRIAVEAHLSLRTVERALTGERMRPSTIYYLCQAWERMQAPQLQPVQASPRAPKFSPRRILQSSKVAR